MISARTCPDCGVTLEGVEITTDYEGHSLAVEEGSGLRGLIADKNFLDAYRCPECGLVRFYAD